MTVKEYHSIQKLLSLRDVMGRMYPEYHSSSHGVQEWAGCIRREIEGEGRRRRGAREKDSVQRAADSG